jgi:sec-independent protein translocase protein TatA
MLGFVLPGPVEILVVVLVILLLFGNRVPGVMRSLGQGLLEFKKGVQGVDDEKSDGTKSAK